MEQFKNFWKSSRNLFGRFWTQITNQLQNGDLTWGVILISVAHYVHVLGRYDIAPVAVGLGVALDTGYYRSIRAVIKQAQNGNSKYFWWSILATIMLTPYSFAYNIYSYALSQGDRHNWVEAGFMGSSVVVTLIALAVLGTVENWAGKAQRKEDNILKVEKTNTRTSQELPGTSQNLPELPAADEQSSGSSKQLRYSALNAEQKILLCTMTELEVIKHFGISGKSAPVWISRAKAELGQ